MEKGEGSRSADSVGHESVPPPGTDVDLVAISSLKFGTSPRSLAETADYVRRLAEMDVDFPPILVHRGTMQVIDGRHRLKAALQRGKTHIKVVYFDGSEADAFIHAVAENVAHGLPLTVADRKAAALRIMASHPHLSDRAIASYAGLAAKTVAHLRRRSSADSPQSNARMGADRRVRPLDGSEGRIRAFQMIGSRPDASLRDIARGAGVSLGTAHDVRRRVRRGDSPLPNGRRGADRSAQPKEKPGSDLVAADHDVRPEQLAVTLRKLAEDPALRYSELGRELLGLLRARTVTVNDFVHLIAAVPAHRADTIAQYAQQCAKNWEMFAHRIAVIKGAEENVTGPGER